jgi:phage host-nuclease inhibitor protein Gam
MLYAMKGNRQYKITEDEKQKFIDRNYKIAKLENNELVFEEIETEESKELERLKEEIEALKAELEEYKKAQEEESEKAKKTKGEGK